VLEVLILPPTFVVRDTIVNRTVAVPLHGVVIEIKRCIALSPKVRYLYE
jgi:hypothetical protein